MLVQDAMSSKVITISPDVSVSDAANLMNDMKIGCIVVTEREKIAGILTERDIISSIVIPGRDARRVRVREIMNSPVVTIEPEKSIEEAADLMSSLKIRRLPVVRGEKMVGILTSSDIVRFYLDVDKFVRELVVKDAGKD
jgi:CBS domain-containing protein